MNPLLVIFSILVRMFPIRWISPVSVASLADSPRRTTSKDCKVMCLWLPFWGWTPVSVRPNPNEGLPSVWRNKHFERGQTMRGQTMRGQAMRGQTLRGQDRNRCHRR